MPQYIYEAIGLLASITVIISYISKDQKKLRIMNLVGSILFIVYGLFIGAFSIILLNAVTIGIHLHRLREMKK